jgi:hypothetical protein
MRALSGFSCGTTFGMLQELDVMDRLISEATQFFDNFVAAFDTFEGSAVARLFVHPYLAVDQHGDQSIFDSPDDTAMYFQEHLDAYKSGGSESCSYQSLDVVPMGSLGALASVTWSLTTADGNEISSWRESYCVSRKDGKMLAYASIDHAA